MARSRLALVVLLILFTVIGQLAVTRRGSGATVEDGHDGTDAGSGRGPTQQGDAVQATGRRLMAKKTTNTCSTEFDKHGGVIVYILGVLLLLNGLAIVCEGGFKDSLVELSSSLRIPEDIAGATFMAAGTSSPELFTALVAAFGNSDDDLGVGTIVGSAIFNILIIIGLSVLLSKSSFSLDWRPLFRDSVYNLVSFAYLVVTFRDGKITWTETLVGLGLYVAYVALMAVNRWLMKGLSWALVTFSMGKFGADDDSAAEMRSIAQLPQSLEDGEAVHQGLLAGEAHRYSDDDDDLGTPQETVDKLLSVGEEQMDMADHDGPLISDEDEASIGDDLEDRIEFGKDIGDGAPEDGPIVMSINLEPPREVRDMDPHTAHAEPTSVMGWVVHVLSWPWELLFSYTVPPATGKFKYQFVATFLLSLLWLAVLTYFMVGWTEAIGCILNIDDGVMGVTFLAIGTSMPDCLTSIAIAKTGRGEMAVCNALGSNIFDILLALTVPWATSMIIFPGDPIKVDNHSLEEYVLVLTGSLLVFFISLMITRMKLTRTHGFVFLVIYVVFFTYAILNELNLFSIL